MKIGPDGTGCDWGSLAGRINTPKENLQFTAAPVPEGMASRMPLARRSCGGAGKGGKGGAGGSFERLCHGQTSLLGLWRLPRPAVGYGREGLLRYEGRGRAWQQGSPWRSVLAATSGSWELQTPAVLDLWTLRPQMNLDGVFEVMWSSLIPMPSLPTPK